MSSIQTDVATALSLVQASGPSVSRPHAASPTVVYQNPIPVGAALVRIRGIDPNDGVEKTGILLVRRAVEPMRGELALPGGYMGYETWQQATAREVSEETGIMIKPVDLCLRKIESVRENTRMIFFSELPYVLPESCLQEFRPHDEVSELVIAFGPRELAFSTHTEQLKRFFERETVRARGENGWKPVSNLESKDEREMLLRVLEVVSKEWPSGGTALVYSALQPNSPIVARITDLADRFGFSMECVGTTGEYGDGDLVYAMSPKGSRELPRTARL